MFFRKKPADETTIKISLFNYPDGKTLEAIIRSADEANTDPNTTIEIICTLTRETLAERRNGNWEINWYPEGTLANTIYALEQFKLA
jgi:hypothetical protein